MSTRLTGYLFLALAMISVGSTVAVSKIIAACMLPFSATALRFAIAFPVFLVMMRVTRTPWPRPNRRDCVILLLQAGAGSVGYTVLLIAGMQFASGADAGVITGMMPVVASMMAFLLLGERPSLSLVCAIILCTLGAFAITLGVDSTGLHFSSHSLLGNALVFAAVVCEGFFILLNKRLDRPIAPLPLSMLMTGIGFCLTIVPAIFEWRSVLDASTAALSGVAYYGLIPTVAGFLLWYAGTERVSGAEASLFTACAPVSALVFAAGLLGEHIGAAQMKGMVCIVVAICLVAWRGKSVRRPALSLNP